ncbi:MAG: SRPBCC domain-containing protein [Calditrichia bacterium]|nr:SRPBCC domain-containing protein [Calditrichota bacterium]
MKRLQFSIDINAPKEKVWNTMLNQDTYRVWADVFMPGSHYLGDWNTGSKILFVAPDTSGNVAGMVSRIKENRQYAYVSIEHLGFVQDGKEDTSSEAVKAWAGALENYTFTESNGTTNVFVELDTAEEHAEMFGDIWPKALEELKKLAEK